MSTLLLENGTVLTLDRDERIIDNGHVFIRDDRIVAVNAGPWRGEEEPKQRIDCRNRLIAPGLVNAHAHSQSSTMAGFGDKLSHPAFMWLTQAHTSRRAPDEIRLAVLLTAYGAITSGTTAIIDHFPGQRFTRADMDAVLSAWQETGMRVVLGARFFDGPFADIFPPMPLPDDVAARAKDLLKPQPLDELDGLLQDIIAAWHGRPRLSVFPAPSNPERCTEAAMVLCAELAERFDTGIHTHLLETRKQADLAQQRFGTTTVQQLAKLGVLSDRWSCAHSIWLTETDIALMAEKQVTAVLNPESNARLGTGLAQIPALLRAGVPLALGSDGASANDNMVLHEAMRAIAMAHRAHEPNRSSWISAREALHMATAGGARAMRQKDLGTLAAGQLADITIYRLDKPWWLPVNDIVCQLVFAETGAGADTVIVDGKVIMEGGVIKTFDVDALVREVKAMAASLRERNADLFAIADKITTLLP
ncbi:MAG TPA: amidohydrolase family protein [Xanthobacteraceae bacterium]|jgi:cytosine/adenosine deaminase-related metal-dependent hydrolase|nr:amidohydrolase family protein [Xanthobacteraceae bacterium]